MSGIFGIYHPDDRPIDKNQLLKMAKATAHRGPDRTNSVQHGHIGFGHCMLCTTPESINERLPFTDFKTGLTITADARIDNRDDLANKIGLYNIDDFPDSQLILLAYQKWGIKSFSKLNGDFSFVIWDSRKQQLICVRDYIGVKPFYYHHTTKQFLFSSEIKPLAEHPDIILDINEGIVGEYLSFSFCSKTETLFTTINRLAPGNYLIVNTDGATTTTYWSWEPKNHLFYKRTSEYAEHFLEIFEKAVENRLRCNNKISAELSGGLDSSTVAGMASKLLKRKANKQLQAYSMIFPGLPCDEKAFINALVKQYDIDITFITCQNYFFSSWRTQVKTTFIPPDPPNLSMNNPLLLAIKQSNIQVILSGIGGDECFTGSGYPYLDYFQKANFHQLIQELLFQCRKGTTPALKKLIINLSWPLIPNAIRSLLTKRIAKRHIPNWLTKSFIDRIQLTNRIHKITPHPILSNLGDILTTSVITGANEQFFLESLDRQRASWQVENRYPFLDQKIFEFAMSIPDYEKQNMGITKQILREQSTSLLPSLIRKRQGKAEFSHTFKQAFPHIYSHFTNSRNPIIKNGWVNKNAFDVAISRKKGLLSNKNCAPGANVWEVWFAFSIDLWYKQIISLKDQSNKEANMNPFKPLTNVQSVPLIKNVKRPYNKPILNNYGSIDKITKGVAGSDFDCSSPGAKIEGEDC